MSNDSSHHTTTEHDPSNTDTESESYGYVRVLVGCGSKKRSEAVAARVMYTSGYFEKKRDFSEIYGDDWYIASAKHHILHPDTVIEPYDKSLTEMSAAERRAWGEETSTELRDLDWDHVDTVVVLMGQDYINPIRTTLETLPVTVAYPFDQTSGNGEQNKWLKREVQRGKHTDPGETPVLSLDPRIEDPGQQTALTNF